MQGTGIKLPPLGYLTSSRSLLPSVMNTAIASVNPVVPNMSTRNAGIRQLLWASVVVSVGVLASSLVSLGALTLWVSPATTILMTIFHVLVLLRLRKECLAHEVEIRLTNPSRVERSPAFQKDPLPPRIPISVTGKLPTAVCAWTLAALWTLCLVFILLGIGTGQYSRLYQQGGGGGLIIRQALEAITTFAQIALTASIAYLCTLEWRAATRSRRTRRLRPEANLPWHSSGRYRF